MRVPERALMMPARKLKPRAIPLWKGFAASNTTFATKSRS